MTRGLTRILTTVALVLVAALGAGSPARADVLCKEYNDRGVCIIAVDTGDDEAREVVSRGGNSDTDETPRYPNCPAPPDVIFEGEDLPGT